ncbi:MAG: glycosyltransferase 87 family protein, partial [Planctomycetota bacterium]
ALRVWAELHPGRDPPWLAMLVALLLVVRFLLRDMAGGGGNLVWLTLVALACIRPGEAPGEDRRPALGALLGLVLATKPTPLLFLGWLALRGRRRTLAVAVATAAALHLAPMLTMGVDGWGRAYGHWLDGVLAYARQDDPFATPAYDFPPFDWMNQCLRCAVARYLGTVPQVHLDELPEGLRFAGLGLEPATYADLSRLLVLALVAASFAVLWRRRRDADPAVEWTAPCLLIPVTLLASPITWKSHHVQLLPLCFALLALGPGARTRRGLRVLLGAYFVLCVLPGGDVVGKLGKEGMQSLYVVTAGAVALWLATLARLARPGRPAP